MGNSHLRYQHKTPMNATNQEDKNSILRDGHKVGDDRHPEPENKPSARGDNDTALYK